MPVAAVAGRPVLRMPTGSCPLFACRLLCSVWLSDEKMNGHGPFVSDTLIAMDPSLVSQAQQTGTLTPLVQR